MVAFPEENMTPLLSRRVELYRAILKIAAQVVFPEIGLDPNGSLQQQVYRALRESILRGRFPEGFRLPPSRTLAVKLGVSRNTVLFAYEELIADGLIAGRTGSGTRIESSGSVEFTDPDGQTILCVGPRSGESVAKADSW